MNENETTGIGFPQDSQQKLRRRAFENDPLWLVGTDPVEANMTDGSINHDFYLYGPLSETAKAEIKDD